MGDSRKNLRRLLPVRLGALVALLVAGASAFPAPAAASQNLSGVWLKSHYTLAAFQLQTSGTKLSATWGIVVGNMSEGFDGRFTGTLNQSGTAYTGPMSVRVGSLSVGGTMSVTIEPQQKFGYPLLAVSYQQNNGVTDSFTLQMWMPRPQAVSSPSPAVTFAFDCPGPKACAYTAQAGTLARGRFTVGPGQSRTVRLPLDKAARTLLAAGRTLHAQVVVTATKKSAPTPYRTTLGSVTLPAR